MMNVSPMWQIEGRQQQGFTYSQPYRLVELGQMSGRKLMLSLHGHMAVDLRTTRRPMVEMHTRRGRGLLVMVRHDWQNKQRSLVGVASAVCSSSDFTAAGCHKCDE